MDSQILKFNLTFIFFYLKIFKKFNQQIKKISQNLRYVKNSFFERNLDHMNWAPLENHVPSEELEDPSELNISFAGISKYFFKRFGSK